MSLNEEATDFKQVLNEHAEHWDEICYCITSSLALLRQHA